MLEGLTIATQVSLVCPLKSLRDFETIGVVPERGKVIGRSQRSP